MGAILSMSIEQLNLEGSPTIAKELMANSPREDHKHEPALTRRASQLNNPKANGLSLV